MARVSPETIKKLNAFIDSLPQEARNKCALCNETLTHLVKTAEVETGAGTATVTRAIAEKINETAAPGDRVSGNLLNQRLRQNEGIKKRTDDLFKRLVTIGRGSGANGYIYFAKKDNEAFKIGQTESSPQGRVASLNGYGENTWKLIHYVELPASAITHKVEKYIHEEFEQYNIGGELFRSECLQVAVEMVNGLAKWLWDTVRLKMSVGHNNPNSTLICSVGSDGTEQNRKEVVKKESAETKFQVPTEAMQFVTIAISQLSRIRKDDPERGVALNRVIEWIEKNR